MLTPLYGFLKGDVVGILVLAHADHTMSDIAAMLSSSASVRIAPQAGRVRIGGQLINGDVTVAASGLTALDRFDVEAEARPL